MGKKRTSILNLPYPPSINHYYMRSNRGVFLSEAGKVYKMTCGLIANQQFDKPMEGQLSVSVQLYRPQRSGDIDNYLKALLDSLNGIAWIDDSQICELHVYRYEGKGNAHAVVSVHKTRRVTMK